MYTSLALEVLNSMQLHADCIDPQIIEKYQLYPLWLYFQLVY